MKRKRNKQWFSMLMATAMVMSSISVPVMAAPVDDAMVQSALAEAGVETSEGREINFNKGWKFHFGDVTGAEAKNYDDSKADEWGDLNLPHDFSIAQEPSNSNEAESGFMPGGTGWYRKRFTLPSDYAGKSVVLNFDGSYNHTYVYVNGTKVGENHYGYNDFAFDISEYLTCDGTTENVISVKVVHQTPSSRWYSGSGIYRDVELIVTDAVHVSRNGTYVTTPNLATEKDGDVTVNVKTKVQNDGNAQAAAQMSAAVIRVSVFSFFLLVRGLRIFSSAHRECLMQAVYFTFFSFRVSHRTSGNVPIETFVFYSIRYNDIILREICQ